MRTSNHSYCLVAVLVISAACGGKGETVTVVDPKTKTELDNCLANLKAKSDLVSSLQAENVKLQTQQKYEITVMIEGNALTVKPGSGTGTPGVPTAPIDNAAAKLASKEFLDLVRKSRGPIQKCYEKALKSTPSLQAKTVTLTVSATFAQSGTYQAARFSPTLGDAFDSCMRAVATKWALPQNSPAMSFQTQVSLTPT